MIRGRQAVRVALENDRAVHRVYISRDARGADVRRLKALASRVGVPFQFVPAAKLNQLAGGTDHQGMVAVVAATSYLELETLLAGLPDDGPVTLVALDRIQNPHNLGLVIRTAVAAGAAGVVVPNRDAAPVDDVVVRSSAGLVLRLPPTRVANLDRALERLKAAGFWIYGLEAKATASVFDVSWPPRRVLVLGNEHEGLRPGVRKRCDELVSIPLAPGVASLNVAVAAGVALFQATRADCSGERGA